MKEVGIAILAYADQHGGALPPDLITIRGTTGAQALLYVCPYTTAKESTNWTSDAAGRAMNALTYVYAGEGLSILKVTAEDPVMFELPNDHDGEGGNILFGDGHVEFVTQAQFLKYVQGVGATGRLNVEERAALRKR